jgi:plasmid stabilization system protein ParE
VSGYSIAPVARLDLQDIVRYIGADSPSAARKVRAALFEAFDSLAAQPGMGHTRPDLTGRDLRFWTVMNRYMIVYREAREQLEIVRVFGPGRDVAAMLG